MIWRRPKIMFKPRAMRAMISPHTTPFKMAIAKLEITNPVLLFKMNSNLSPSLFYSLE
jgi:hypothetical protein